MSTAAGIPEFVRLARQRWNEGRLLLRGQHDAGNPGKRTVHAFSDLLDLLLLTLHREITAEGSLDQRLALVLHGGSGRREFVPYSDVDLMVLHEGPLDDGLTVYAQRLTQAINDAGLMLGFSLRSSREACAGVIVLRFSISSVTYSLFSKWLRRVFPRIACSSPSRTIEFTFWSNIRRLFARFGTFVAAAPSILSFT
ncbi:MAG: DUF294 nucleotidyltransferase-like domain-containing protein [Planctomycetota bacterium]